VRRATTFILWLIQSLAREDRGQLFENLLVMRVAVCPESFAGVAEGVPPELVAEIVRVAEVVETIAAALASRQKMSIVRCRCGWSAKGNRQIQQFG
jgi:hypothetical protein